MGHDQGRPGAAGRTDRPEQVSAFVALVGRLARPRTASRPDPHEAVLLAKAHLVLEPDLDGFVRADPGEMGVQGRGDGFVNSATIRSS